MKAHSKTSPVCPAWRPHLLDALEGRLAAEQREALAEHLSACSVCAREYEALRGTLALLDAHRLPTPDEDYWRDLSARVRRALAEEPAPRRWAIPGPRPAWAALAGSLALLALALAWWGTQAPRPDAGQRWLARMETRSRSELREGLAANAAVLDQVLAEESELAPEPDPDLMLEDLTAAELIELSARLDGLKG